MCSHFLYSHSNVLNVKINKSAVCLWFHFMKYWSWNFTDALCQYNLKWFWYMSLCFKNEPHECLYSITTFSYTKYFVHSYTVDIALTLSLYMIITFFPDKKNSLLPIKSSSSRLGSKHHKTAFCEGDHNQTNSKMIVLQDLALLVL